MTDKTRNELLEEILAATGGQAVDNLSGGILDYNDATTAVTPISVTAAAGFVELTNDGAGPFTNKAYAPSAVTDVWDSSLNQFDFSQLKLGDMVDVRMELEVTTTSANQSVKVDLFLGTGAGAYQVPFIFAKPKTAGVHTLNRFNGFYMGDANTLDNPAKFKIQSDANCTVVVVGWYCKILVRG